MVTVSVTNEKQLFLDISTVDVEHMEYGVISVKLWFEKLLVASINYIFSVLRVSPLSRQDFL